MLYVAIFTVMLLLQAGLRSSPKLQRPIYGLGLVFLFLFSAFRYEVGCDWTGYLNQFLYPERFQQFQGLNSIGEPLWWFIINQMRDLDLAYPWLNVVSSMIFFSGIHVLARRQPAPFTFLLIMFPLLVIGLAMSGIRQAAATGVLCIALTAFLDGKRLRFVALIAVAAMLHSSASIFLLLTPLVSGTFSKGRMAFAFLLAIPGALALINTSAATIAIARYVTTDVDAAGAVFRATFLALSGAFFLAFLRRPWREFSPGDYKLAIVGSFAMLAVLAILPISSVISDRIGYYLIPIQAMIFARIPYLGLGRAGSRYSLGFFAALTALFLTWTSISTLFEACYLPYQSWIFGEPNASKY